MSERVLCVDDNLDALLWRLRMINGAQKSLVLSTFEWREDASGLTVMSALWAAAERGVTIRLFLDGVYGLLDLKKSHPFHALLSHPNVTAKFYNAIVPVNLPRVNYRMHDKYLIMDEKAYLLGGRNTYDFFLGETTGRKNIDRELLVVEENLSDPHSSLAQLEAYFASIWEQPSNRTEPSGISGKRLTEGLNTLQERADGLRDQFPSAYTQTDFTAATFPVKQITLMSNPQKNGHKEPTLWKQACAQMKGRKNVLIQTPYIICGKEMYRDLQAVCSTSDQVGILTNAVENGANPWGCTDYLNQKQTILQTGATVYEFIGNRSVHTKMILMDDDISIVGSYNMDMRSTYLDTELMLAVECRELNSQLRKIAEAQIQQCRQVSPDGTVKDGPNYVPRPLPRQKRRIYFIMQRLTRLEPVRGLL